MIWRRRRRGFKCPTLGVKMNLYKRLWSKIGGRPWTYIWRDLYHQAEWLMQALWFFGGVAVGVYFGWKYALIAGAIYTLGYINGHFHWGTKWIQGQQGK